MLSAAAWGSRAMKPLKSKRAGRKNFPMIRMPVRHELTLIVQGFMPAARRLERTSAPNDGAKGLSPTK